MAAAAEARAAWQRAANRCLVQEDAKRAPKLACCPPPVQPHDCSGGGNPPASPQDLHVPNLVAVDWNLPSDTRWWPNNFGCQTAPAQDHLDCSGGEAADKGTERLVPPPASKLEDAEANKSLDEPPPWIVSTALANQTSETGVEQQLKTPTGYAATSLKCRGNAKNYAHGDKDFKAFDPLFPMKPHKEYCEMNVPWDGSRKSQPWWQVSGPVPDTTVCSLAVSSTETNSSDGGSWQQHQQNGIPRVEQDSYSPTDSTSGSRATYQNASERATLLDALQHSQTRAREAEMAAKKAYDEKGHVIKLLFRQASHLFACKQWLKMLQLENICLQLRLKEQQIATMFPELPWMMVKEKVAPGQDRKEGTRKRGRKPNRKGCIRNTVVFVVGVGVVGAGLLLGWTLGCLLPKL